MDKKKIFDVGKYISDEMEDLEIPESLSPENMKAKLEGKQIKEKKNFRQRNEYQNDIRFLKEHFKHCVGRYSAAWPASL